MAEDIKVPEISENVTAGKFVKVLVAAGDEVRVDDPIIEFETEKAVVEIPSPYAGRITEVLVEEGDELKVGDTIARIDTEAADGETQAPARKEAPDEPEKEASAPREKPGEAEEPSEAAPSEAEIADGEGPPPRETPARERPEPGDEARGPAPASPSVRRLARELGVDIHAVRASETGGRIKEADVKAYVKRTLEGEPERTSRGVSGPAIAPRLPDFSRWGPVESRELSGVRRLTAESMSVAWRTVAHVTQFERVDVTDAERFIARHADRVADKGGKLTLTAVVMKVCALALRRFERFNASIDPEADRLILKHYVHIGLAVDTPRGLLVPVVRDADRKSIVQLAIEIVDLARRTRDKKIKPDEMEGGTFTISNQGSIGGTDFTPVVYWPQAAILGLSRVAVEPRHRDGEWHPRRILPLALSYDHRIVDGADATRFTKWIREGIEQPLSLHLE